MRRQNTIYLDYQASTPCDSQVIAKMAPYWDKAFGNPHSSDHIIGWEAGKSVTQSAQSVATLIGADPNEIVFTSGATEANNLALFGLARQGPANRRKILVSAIEHKCVLAAQRALSAQNGFTIDTLPVDRQGHVDLEALDELMDDSVLMLSVMAVNNEIGTLQDIQKISEIAASYGTLFHCDAAQAPCAMDLHDLARHTDLLSLSAHKMYGPQGIGVLYVRHELYGQMEPMIHGGGQQNGLRSGTVPVALCAGMAEASRMIASPDARKERQRIANQRDTLVSLLEGGSFPVLVNGPPAEARHPGNANIQFPGFDAQEILGALQPKLAASTGSACTTGDPEPSHVLRAIGLDQTQSDASIRFSCGRYTSDQDIEQAAQMILATLERIARENYRKSA